MSESAPKSEQMDKCPVQAECPTDLPTGPRAGPPPSPDTLGKQALLPQHGLEFTHYSTLGAWLEGTSAAVAVIGPHSVSSQLSFPSFLLETLCLCLCDRARASLIPPPRNFSTHSLYLSLQLGSGLPWPLDWEEFSNPLFLLPGLSLVQP